MAGFWFCKQGYEPLVIMMEIIHYTNNCKLFKVYPATFSYLITHFLSYKDMQH